MGQKSGNRQRLDLLMVSRGLAESREQAKRLVLAGEVAIIGIVLPKPGQLVDTSLQITLKEKERYVSRGGLKLEAALKAFNLDITAMVCADIGASTGGFTDCMLQHGARQVYAVDVGVTQMHERIRSNSRVVLVEHTNAKHLTSDYFPHPVQFAAVDVSFISILKVAAPLLSILVPGAHAVLLIKPQFEAGRKAVAKGRGVIKDKAIHRDVLRDVISGLEEQNWIVLGLIASPLAGGSGNREFLCHVYRRADNEPIAAPRHIDIDEVIHSTGANE